VAERVGFEPTQTPIEISKFMKNLRLCVPSRPLLSPLLAVDLAVGQSSRPHLNPSIVFSGSCLQSSTRNTMHVSPSTL
jgi:hypothetical protein